jgi:hypothetical protein
MLRMLVNTFLANVMLAIFAVEYIYFFGVFSTLLKIGCFSLRFYHNKIYN